MTGSVPNVQNITIDLGWGCTMIDCLTTDTWKIIWELVANVLQRKSQAMVCVHSRDPAIALGGSDTIAMHNLPDLTTALNRVVDEHHSIGILSIGDVSYKNGDRIPLLQTILRLSTQRLVLPFRWIGEYCVDHPDVTTIGHSITHLVLRTPPRMPDDEIEWRTM